MQQHTMKQIDAGSHPAAQPNRIYAGSNVRTHLATEDSVSSMESNGTL